MQAECNRMIQIRWHGRGGQGAITAAKMVAVAAFRSGYEGVVMAPTFGTERRGAPVTTSLKIARDKIYDLSPIETPDIVVVLDHLILNEVDVTAGLKPDGWLVINSPRPVKDYQIYGYHVAVANVTHLGIDAGLPKGIVNSGIIGVLARASSLLDIDLLADCIAAEFEDRRPEANAQSARMAFAAAQISEPFAGDIND